MECEAEVRKGVPGWGWVALSPGVKLALCPPGLCPVPIPQVEEAAANIKAKLHSRDTKWTAEWAHG